MPICRMCRSSDLRPVIDLGAMPIAHRMLRAPDEREERFPFNVIVCGDCGLPQIEQPIDPDILYRDFNFNFSSWKPEPHQDDELDTIHSFVQPRAVFEIGCNDGLFLERLRQTGAELLVGVEPNPVSGKIARERGLLVYGDMVNPAMCDDAVAQFGKFDLVVSRQVLEHIADFDNFFDCVDRVLNDDGHLFLDAPNFAPGRSVGDVSVLWEEHVNYFTEETLLSLLARKVFEAVSVKTYNFSGGSLAVCARRGSSGAAGADANAAAAAACFGQLAREYGERLGAALARVRGKGMEVAIYGAGCRATMLANAHQLGSLVDCAVDDQRERHGMYLSGSRIPVRDAAVLAERDSPLVCLLAVNNENEAKVSERLRASVGRPVHFSSIFAPADIWQNLKTLESL